MMIGPQGRRNPRQHECPMMAPTPQAHNPVGKKRDIALEIPIWNPDLCIQCGKCSMVCSPCRNPHPNVYKEEHPCERSRNLQEANLPNFREMARWLRLDRSGFPHRTALVCGLCVENCPGRDSPEPRKTKLFLMGDKMRCPRNRKLKTGSSFLDLPSHPPR